jgi:hypothetical protein
MYANFHPTLRESIGTQVVAIDQQNRTFGVTTGNNWYILPLEQIRRVEIYQETNSLIKTNRGSQVVGAAVGGALLGPVGLLVGGLTGSKREEQFITKLMLFLYTTNIHAPVIELLFHNKSNAGPSQGQLKRLHRWRAIIEASIGSSG